MKKTILLSIFVFTLSAQPTYAWEWRDVGRIAGKAAKSVVKKPILFLGVGVAATSEAVACSKQGKSGVEIAVCAAKGGGRKAVDAAKQSYDEAKDIATDAYNLSKEVID